MLDVFRYRFSFVGISISKQRFRSCTLAMPLMELYNLQNHDITSSKFTFPTGSNYSVASRQLWGDSDLSEWWVVKLCTLLMLLPFFIFSVLLISAKAINFIRIFWERTFKDAGCKMRVLNFLDIISYAAILRNHWIICRSVSMHSQHLQSVLANRPQKLKTGRKRQGGDELCRESRKAPAGGQQICRRF